MNLGSIKPLLLTDQQSVSPLTTSLHAKIAPNSFPRDSSSPGYRQTYNLHSPNYVYLWYYAPNAILIAIPRTSLSKVEQF